MSRMIAVLVAGFLSGCATEIYVTPDAKVGTDLQPGDKVDGIPFRVRDRFLVQVFRKTDTGYEKVKTSEPEHFESLADPNRLFVLHYHGEPLADGTSKIVLRADSTLTTVDVTSTSEGASTLDAFTAGAASLRNQISNNQNANITDDVDFTTNCDELRKAEAVKAELPSSTANSAVLEAQLAIDKAKGVILKMHRDPNACPSAP